MNRRAKVIVITVIALLLCIPINHAWRMIVEGHQIDDLLSSRDNVARVMKELRPNIVGGSILVEGKDYSSRHSMTFAQALTVYDAIIKGDITGHEYRQGDTSYSPRARVASLIERVEFQTRYHHVISFQLVQGTRDVEFIYSRNDGHTQIMSSNRPAQELIEVLNQVRANVGVSR